MLMYESHKLIVRVGIVGMRKVPRRMHFSPLSEMMVEIVSAMNATNEVTKDQIKTASLVKLWLLPATSVGVAFGAYYSLSLLVEENRITSEATDVLYDHWIVISVVLFYVSLHLYALVGPQVSMKESKSPTSYIETPSKKSISSGSKPPAGKEKTKVKLQQAQKKIPLASKQPLYKPATPSTTEMDDTAHSTLSLPDVVSVGISSVSSHSSTHSPLEHLDEDQALALELHLQDILGIEKPGDDLLEDEKSNSETLGGDP